jgi:hypothetical protein
MATTQETVTGVKVGGREPKALLLSDGTRLALEDVGAAGGVPSWVRVGADDDRQLTIEDALSLAGDEYAGYVKIRTRAEAAWLELVGEWYRVEADRLRGQVDQLTPARSFD